MSTTTQLASPADCGLEVIDALSDPEFAQRKRTHRSLSEQLEGMRRLAHAFVGSPEIILNELVRAAVELCGADSAGISLERPECGDNEFWHWVATAGEYTAFTNAVLPRYPSACGVCLQRGAPQVFRVHQRFFDIMGISAPVITDGLLLPWQVDNSRGTIFIMAHGRSEAFDAEDCKVMQILADFAAMGVRQQRQHRQIVEQAGSTAAAAMANKLAHRINNPLQSLTNTFFLASMGHHGEEARQLGEEASEDLERLSRTVQQLLALPFAPRED